MAITNFSCRSTDNFLPKPAGQGFLLLGTRLKHGNVLEVIQGGLDRPPCWLWTAPWANPTKKSWGYHNDISTKMATIRFTGFLTKFSSDVPLVGLGPCQSHRSEQRQVLLTTKGQPSLTRAGVTLRASRGRLTFLISVWSNLSRRSTPLIVPRAWWNRIIGLDGCQRS